MPDIDAMTLIMDNNDRDRYWALRDAAEAAIKNMVPAPTLEQYRGAVRGPDGVGSPTFHAVSTERSRYTGAVGEAVADLLEKWLEELDMDEWWKAILVDQLRLSSPDVRHALGYHYLPEPADMEAALSTA